MIPDVDLKSLFSLEEPEGMEPPLVPTTFFASSLDFLAQFHRKKSEALREILDMQGWPDAKQYGEHAEATAFIIALHSDYNLELQVRCHQALLANALKGEGNLGFLAFLTDRILCNKGLHQRFGTQIREADNGCFVPKAIENADKIEEWRQLVQLGETMADYYQRVNDGDLVLYRPIMNGYVEELELQKQNKILEFPKKN
jgi:hypothetical protein